MRPSMITVWIIPVALPFLTALPFAGQTDNTFEQTDSFDQGYQAEDGNSISPVAPIPGVPEPGQDYFPEGTKEGAEAEQPQNGQDYQNGVDADALPEQDDSTDRGAGGYDEN
jgi:hypothetical protein